ncbi:MAG: DUF4338 domain-containing protein [Sedimenticola sp.]
MSIDATVDWVQCGRAFSEQEIEQIRETVAYLPRLSRRELASTVCEHLDWSTASGTPKRQACEKLLEKLEAAGLIALPVSRAVKTSPVSRTKVTLSERTRAGTPVISRLSELDPVHLALVTTREETALWNEYVERFHPLGYKGVFGYRLRYFILCGSLRLGCILLGGGAKAIAVRDQWIGWDPQLRLRNLPWIINNSRFLIFPHIQVPHLASHVLGQLARRVSDDWHIRWGFSPLLMETFVDPRQYTGACYRAAGWELLGETSGRGLTRPGKQYQSTPRWVLVKPLQKEFRQRLCTTPLSGRVVS